VRIKVQPKGGDHDDKPTDIHHSARCRQEYSRRSSRGRAGDDQQAGRAQEAFDAIVIGTGFGGAVATIALSASGKKTLVIERGTFWVTPETLGAPTAPSNAVIDFANRNKMRVQFWSRPDHALGVLDLLANGYHDGNPYGLHNYRMFRHAHVLTASGVGGGSLIYSNVNLQARPAVLDRIGLKGIDYNRAQKFMERYRGKFNKVVTKIPLPAGVTLEQLGNKLDPAQASKDYLLLDRSRALRDASDLVAKQIGVAMPWSPLDLSITEYTDGNNAASDPAAGSDIVHTFCERQGRCMLGCLPAARHTLNKTLVKFVFSKNSQVTLSPESEVRTIKRVGDTYEVTYIDRRGDPNLEAQTKTVRASQVFLAAGVLGTTEILLRSQGSSLVFSDKLGSGFSTNGDFGALAVGTKMIGADGKPVRLPDGTAAKASVYPTRGPINTADVRFEIDGKHYTIEDCGIPSMFAKIVRTGLDDRNRLKELENPGRWIDDQYSSTTTNTLLASLRRLFFGSRGNSKDRHSTEAELIDDVFFFNAMAEDEANGILTLKNDKIDLNWPDDKPIANQACFGKIEEIIRKLSEAMGGAYTPLPTWEGLADVFAQKTLIVTHPLGGCRIGATMAEGVVNEFGQVFDGSKKTIDPLAVHPGLFIVDGSVMPGALAANPTLTITAQSLKAIERAVGPIPL
jgi:cholesterol oxidase